MVSELTKVSVVIPTFNHSNYVLQAIQSVRENTHGDVEIIVIDDGSSDGTDRLLEDVSDIKYVRQQNQGAHSALNHGIQIATGEIISILNDDDLFFPEHISAGVKNLKSTGNDLYVSFPTTIGEGSKLKIMENHLVHSRNQIGEFGFQKALFKTNWSTSTSAFIFRRNLAENLEGFSAFKMCHDLDFLLRTLIEGKSSIGVSLKPSWHYRCHENNSGTHISLLRQNAEILYAIGASLSILAPFLTFKDLINLIDYGIPKHLVAYSINVQPWKKELILTKEDAIEEWVVQFTNYADQIHGSRDQL
jgi:glycosyltransferase involved in cell wall biosynthesis